MKIFVSTRYPLRHSATKCFFGSADAGTQVRHSDDAAMTSAIQNTDVSEHDLHRRDITGICRPKWRRQQGRSHTHRSTRELMNVAVLYNIECVLVGIVNIYFLWCTVHGAGETRPFRR